ncbi:MAG: copper amine oxidase N-terminal domain-containing protein [Oscillospiraceae bacterium]|nr:copper amine oxidase N-terminal domain-containing protein [Oscillospiraceae bacterium]
MIIKGKQFKRVLSVCMAVALIIGIGMFGAGTALALEKSVLEMEWDGLKLEMTPFYGETDEFLIPGIGSTPTTLSVYLLESENELVKSTMTFPEYIQGEKIVSWTWLESPMFEIAIEGDYISGTELTATRYSQIGVQHRQSLFELESESGWIFEPWYSVWYIALTPSMADEYLNKGTFSYGYDGPGEDGPAWHTVDIEIPGLREIILAARGETTPPPPATPIATPYPNVGVTLDGEKIPVAVFGIDGNIYLKLRDLAVALDVHAEWDASVPAVRLDSTRPTNLTPSVDPLPTDDVPATSRPDVKVFLNGTEINAAVFGIDGSTILGLGDIARALNLNPNWDGETSTAVLTRAGS